MPRNLTPQERLIWSADVATPDDVLARVAAEPRIQLVKIDRLFIDRHSLEVVHHLVSVLYEKNVQVFLDAKLVEVPSKLAALAELYMTSGPAMLNCMAGCVSNGNINGLRPDTKELDGLKQFADVCHSAGVMPVAVTVLTSKEPDIVADEFNGRLPVEEVLWYVDMLYRMGFGGVVCSAEEVEAIRRRSEFNELELLTPGVRLPGSDAHDQARVATPGEAIARGATRVVSGRDITKDPSGQNVGRILEEIQAAEFMAA